MRQYLKARKIFSLRVLIAAHGFMSFPSWKTSFQDLSIDQTSNAADGDVIMPHYYCSYLCSFSLRWVSRQYQTLCWVKCFRSSNRAHSHNISKTNYKFLSFYLFSFRVRSILCGAAAANRYIFAAIATKSYYNIELWLSLPGSMVLYGTLSFIG